MAQFGKSKQDVVKALQMLQNPMVSGTLNRFAPGIADRIKQTGEMAMQSTPDVSSSPSSVNPTPTDQTSDLRRRIANL